MKKLLVVVLMAVMSSANVAFGASDADGSSIDCTGNNGNYVRITVPVEILPIDSNANGSIVNFRFSSGMSGKDIIRPLRDGQSNGAKMTFEGYCGTTIPGGTPYLDINWAYDSGIDGGAYSVTIGNILKISRI